MPLRRKQQQNKTLVNQNFKYNSRNKVQSLSKLAPNNKFPRIEVRVNVLPLSSKRKLLRLSGSLAYRGLQTSAARTPHSRKRGAGRRSSTEPRDRLNDKHQQIWLNEACEGLGLAVFALLQGRRVFLQLNPSG